MFTGIVQEIGRVTVIKPTGGGIRMTVACPRAARELHVGDSIAVNGVCLTAVARSSGNFTADVVEETLSKTTLGELKKSVRVNLELPMKVDDRLGGHLVLGHVDAVGTVESVEDRETSKLVTVVFPPEFGRYLIPGGSVAVDGVSLTVASLEGHRFAVSIIPHTIEKTILRDAKKGMRVNLEFDVLGKYVERLGSQGRTELTASTLTREKLKEWGYGGS